MSHFNELQFCWLIFKNSSNTKFHEKHSNGSRVFQCWETQGRTDGQMDRRTDMTKPIVVLRSFTNAPESLRLSPLRQIPVQLLHIKLKWRYTKQVSHLSCIGVKRDLLFYVTNICYKCWWKTSRYGVKNASKSTKNLGSWGTGFQRLHTLTYADHVVFLRH
jgi:hypothetical protein